MVLTIFQEAGKAQIRKMPRAQKESILQPWMEKSHSGTSTRNDGLNVLNELSQWRTWSAQTRRQETVLTFLVDL